MDAVIRNDILGWSSERFDRYVLPSSQALWKSPVWDVHQARLQNWPGDTSKPFNHMAYMYNLDPRTEDSAYQTANNPKGIRIWENAYRTSSKSPRWNTPPLWDADQARLQNWPGDKSQPFNHKKYMYRLDPSSEDSTDPTANNPKGIRIWENAYRAGRPKNPPATSQRGIFSHNRWQVNSINETCGDSSSYDIAPHSDPSIEHHQYGLGSRCIYGSEEEDVISSPDPTISPNQSIPSNYATQAADVNFGYTTFPSSGGSDTGHTADNSSSSHQTDSKAVSRRSSLLSSYSQETQPLLGMASTSDDEPQTDNEDGPSRPTSPAHLSSNTPSLPEPTTIKPDLTSREGNEAAKPSDTPSGTPGNSRSSIKSESNPLSLEKQLTPSSPDKELSSGSQGTGKGVEVAVDDWKPLIIPNTANRWAFQFETLHPVTSETVVPTSDLPGASNSEEEPQSHRRLGPCGTGEMRYTDPVRLYTNTHRKNLGLQSFNDVAPPPKNLRWRESSFRRFFKTYRNVQIAGPWWRTRYRSLGQCILMPKPRHIPECERLHHDHIPRHVLPTLPLGHWEDSQCERFLGFRWNLDVRNEEGVLPPSVKDSLRRSLSFSRNDNRYNMVYTLTEETLQECHEIFSEPRASEIRQSFELRGIPHKEQVEWAETFDNYKTPGQ